MSIFGSEITMDLRTSSMLSAMVIAAVLGSLAWCSSQRKRVVATLVAQPNSTDVSLPGDRLRLLSHNVWGHYAVGGKELSGRLDALARHVDAADVDVVCLQELFVLQAGPVAHVEHFIRFAERMHALGLVHAVDPLAGMRPILQNSGLALFSRYPIERWTHSAFAATAEPISSKGVMTASLRVGSGIWHVVNTHLDSRNEDSRRQQTREVAAIASGLAVTEKVDDTHLIVLGDFNMGPGSSLYEGLAAAMAAAGAAKDLFPGPTANAPTCVYKTKWIDHVFVSSRAAARLLRRAVVELCVDGSGTSFEGLDESQSFGRAFCDGDAISAAAASSALAVSDHRGLLMDFVV